MNKFVGLVCMFCTVVTLWAEEAQKTEDVKKHFVYFKTGNTAPAKNFKELPLHSIQFGIGSRLKGMHGLDIASSFNLNQNMLQTNLEFNYLFSPEVFCGAYMGVGAHVGTVLSMFHHINSEATDRIAPVFIQYEDSNELITIENITNPYLTQVWNLDYFADIPFILGYNYEVEGRHHFIQGQINKDLHVTLSAGVGF